MPFNYPNQAPIDYINPQPIYGRPANVSSFPDKVDVLIVGAGPAGMMAANALSSFGVNVRVIDQRPHSVFAGQADGIQPRTIEVLQSYGLGSRLLREGNHMWYVFIYSLKLIRKIARHEFKP
jgi:2-polyprenyl-6-methoxyphenol hydroxylase-like FAD-dependent oxidoreductase